jgi:hypothetical protein
MLVVYFADSVGFQILTMLALKSGIFWDVTRYSPVQVDRRFEGT